MLETISLSCPSCGAALPVFGGEELVCCEYCGTTVRMEKRSEMVTRYVDEAAVLREKNEQQRLSLLEKQMQKEASHAKGKKLRVLNILHSINIILCAISLVFCAYLPEGEGEGWGAMVVITGFAWISLAHLIRSEKERLAFERSARGGAEKDRSPEQFSAAGESMLQVYRILRLISIIACIVSFVMISPADEDNFWAGVMIVAAFSWLIFSFKIRGKSSHVYFLARDRLSEQERQKLDLWQTVRTVGLAGLLLGFLFYNRFAYTVTEPLLDAVMTAMGIAWLLAKLRIRSLLSHEQNKKDEPR